MVIIITYFILGIAATGTALEYSSLRFFGANLKERIVFWILTTTILIVGVPYSMLLTYTYTQAIMDSKESMVDATLNNEIINLLVILNLICFKTCIQNQFAFVICMGIMLFCDQKRILSSGDIKGFLIVALICNLISYPFSLVIYLGFVIWTNLFTVAYGIIIKKIRYVPLFPGMFFGTLMMCVTI